MQPVKIFLVVALLFLSACSQAPYPVIHQSEVAPIRNNIAYVDSHGWHTGFIIPAVPEDSDLPFLPQRFEGHALYYEFGWGDKGFYQAKEITTGLTLGAMFWSSGSVMHVVALDRSPSNYFPQSEIIQLKLSDNEFKDLIRFIHHSFLYNASGKPILLQHGIYGDSQFYEGSGVYNITNTCNKWTAKGLKSAGFAASPALKLTAGSVIGYLKATAAKPAASQEPTPIHHMTTSAIAK